MISCLGLRACGENGGDDQADACSLHHNLQQRQPGHELTDAATEEARALLCNRVAQHRPQQGKGLQQ